MSGFRKKAGIAIASTSGLAAIVLASDRYAEFASGAEGLLSYAIPPVALMVISATAFFAIKLGYRGESENNA